jgi:hypothetical protein
MNVIEEFILKLKQDLNEINEQIKTIDKVRIGDLNNLVLRTQCRGILEHLRKERDELRRIIGSEAYKRVVNSSGSGIVPEKDLARLTIKISSRIQQKDLGYKAESVDNNRSSNVPG